MGRMQQLSQLARSPSRVVSDNVAELIQSSPNSEPKGFAGEERSTGLVRGGLLEHQPDRDSLEDYRQVYENHTVVAEAINNFAAEVVEPGWYITADSDETASELTEFMQGVGVANLEPNVNFSVFAKKLVIEREVRGTAFVEKVSDDDGNWTALYPLQNDTITIYTKPGKAMLPAPDDAEASPIDVDLSGQEFRTPIDEQGRVGAYVQFDQIKPRWNHREEVVYTRDQVIHWPRDPDVGDARGTSRIQRIMTRADSLIQKLEDNDSAIKTKAWPHILFNMGTEENPWTLDEIRNFMSDYEDETLGPGMMNAVSGDVSVEEFAGETADIGDALDFDINWIMSGLPGPVYGIGGFSQNVAPAVAQVQERIYMKEVRETRRQIEAKFTPFLREVAEQHGLENPDSVQLNVARPEGEVAPEDVQGSIIRYSTESPQGAQDESDDTGPRTSTGPNTGQREINPSQSEQESGISFSLLEADVEGDVAELADSRLVNTTDDAASVSDVVSEALIDAKERALQRLETEHPDSPVAGAGAFDRIARRSAEQALSNANVSVRVRPIMETVIEDTIATIGQDNHNPTIDVPFGVRHRQKARDIAANVEEQTRQAVDNILADVKTHTDYGAQNGDTMSDIIERIDNVWPDGKLERRAEVIGHMEVENAVNSTKLVEYERHPEIDGIRVLNSCGQKTTPLCRELVGCSGDSAVAWFDVDESVSDQFESQTTAELYEGFDPLPPIPPFHFGCTSEIIPATRDQ